MKLNPNTAFIVHANPERIPVRAIVQLDDDFNRYDVLRSLPLSDAFESEYVNTSDWLDTKDIPLDVDAYCMGSEL